MLKKRMHLWFESDEDGAWHCVDGCVIGAEDGQLDRNSLGAHGGSPHPDAICLEGHEDPNCRPLLCIMQDECAYRSKVQYHKVWHEGTKRPCKAKDAGLGRMISGFAEEFLGFINISSAQLDAANATRRSRTEHKCAMEHRDFMIKKLDYGKNREGYWIADDLIAHTIEVMDGLEAKYGEM